MSFEASCVLAAVKPINIKIKEILDIYRGTHITGENVVLEEVPKLSEWPHPADRKAFKKQKKTYNMI